MKSFIVHFGPKNRDDAAELVVVMTAKSKAWVRIDFEIQWSNYKIMSIEEVSPVKRGKT